MIHDNGDLRAESGKTQVQSEHEAASHAALFGAAYEQQSGTKPDKQADAAMQVADNASWTTQKMNSGLATWLSKPVWTLEPMNQGLVQRLKK